MPKTGNNYEAPKDEQLASVEYELQEVQAQIQSLQEHKKLLERQRDQLKDSLLLEKSSALANQNWTDRCFPWSGQVDEVLKNVFKLEEFRPQQLAAVNAVLKKEDVILIMPTGGGKSLCYQLPAHVRPGVVLVVCPLVSLMEDQLMGLGRLGVAAAMLNANSTKQGVDDIQKAMLDGKASLRLLYVTPEKLAKSKRFMTKLQKMYQMGRLSLIAIDEVHCCSQWGHDFRPDYKFLGVLKPMFPDVPLLGLTATATSRVIVDTQKMLGIQGCLVLKATFNRPNLYYEVRQKPSVQKECMDELAALLKGKYAGQSGIIYSTSIKECEELMQDLRARGLRVGCYHASLEAALRSKVHTKWMSGEYQAVVATIAFGLGIDKPDVRFVIHHCLSKSMENFYQESGRAGRDNKNADCIVFYRFMDVFKLSTMVFTQQTGLENLYGIVAYCLDTNRCRRSIIASHFDEAWETSDCNSMCDHCRQSREVKKVEVTSYCLALYKILAHAGASDTRLTAQKLVDAWLGKGAANLRVSGVAVPQLTRQTVEAIVAHLLIEGYLKEDFHFTPYSTISYIRRGVKANVAEHSDHKIYMNVCGKSLPAKTAVPASSVSGQANYTVATKAKKSMASSINKVAKEHQKVTDNQQRSSGGVVSGSCKRKSAPPSLGFISDDENVADDKPTKKKKVVSIILSSDSD